MTARTVRRRPRRALRWRMALYLAVLTAVLFDVTAGLLGKFLMQRLELRAQVELQARLRAVDDLLEGTGAEIESTLERLERRLTGRSGGSAHALLLGGSEAVPVASAWMDLTGLDLLTVLDDTGQTVSAGHWPERAGLNEPILSRLVESRPVSVSIAWPDGGKLVLLVARRIAVGDRRLVLVGGRVLESLLPARFEKGVAWSFDFEEPVRKGGPFSDPEVAGLGRSAGGPANVTTKQAAYARRILHGPNDEETGAVVVAVERQSIHAMLQEMRIAALFAGLLVTALGAVAGIWIAGRIDRPVRQLVRAVDAIGAGEADYAFPRATRDEFEELEQAFSRLQRSLERQRQRSVAAERIAAWREVARHVAHEVKNPLAPIRLTVENLIRARKEDPRLFDELFDEGAATILEEVEQLRQLVEEFSAFARLPRPEPARVDLHLLIDGVLELYAAEPGLEIRKEYDAEVSEFQLDSDQISRVFKNIIGNAVEALRDQEPGRPRRIDLRTWLEPDMVVVEVADSGPGLSTEARERIFQPYFTTKRQGTGLGMAISQRIVTEHGGLLAAENRSAGGACLSIRLPRSVPPMTAGRAVLPDSDEANR